MKVAAGSTFQAPFTYASMPVPNRNTSDHHQARAGSSSSSLSDRKTNTVAMPPSNANVSDAPAFATVVSSPSVVGSCAPNTTEAHAAGSISSVAPMSLASYQVPLLM